MSLVQGILKHLEATCFGTAATPPGKLAACLHFPRYTLFFSLDVLPGEKSYLQQSGICSLVGSAVRQPQLFCHTQQKSGRKSTAFFCPSQSECAARPTPSGSIRFVVEVQGSCVRVCDGSAPFKRDGFAERVQTIC